MTAGPVVAGMCLSQIVKKRLRVDALMALCDEPEARLKERAVVPGR
ncbi:hypothetical protein [Methanoregula sp.]